MYIRYDFSPVFTHLRNGIEIRNCFLTRIGLRRCHSHIDIICSEVMLGDREGYGLCSLVILAVAHGVLNSAVIKDSLRNYRVCQVDNDLLRLILNHLILGTVGIGHGDHMIAFFCNRHRCSVLIAVVLPCTQICSSAVIQYHNIALIEVVFHNLDSCCCGILVVENCAGLLSLILIGLTVKLGVLINHSVCSAEGYCSIRRNRIDDHTGESSSVCILITIGRTAIQGIVICSYN